jgi:hypothetical protein
MKKVLLLLLVTFSVLCGYSQDTKQLVINTLSGKLKESQFSKTGNYFINVDTVLTREAKSIFTFVYNEYETKNEMVTNINELMAQFDFNDYYNLQEFNNVPIFLSKKHVSVLANKGDNVYLIDWWFSEDKDISKLKGITIKLSKKES